MKNFLVLVLLAAVQPLSAATEPQCLAGNFAACKEIFNRFGATTKKDGAVDFFSKVCNSGNLRVDCQIYSTDSSKTSQKLLDLADRDVGLFAMTGQKFDKIYVVRAAKSSGPDQK